VTRVNITVAAKYTIEFQTTVYPHPASSPSQIHLSIVSFQFSQIRPLQLDAMSRYSWVILVVIFASLYLSFASYLPSDQKHPTDTELQYMRPHSLGHGYTFDPRDGWQTVNVSNLSYKYTSPRSPNIRSATKIIPQRTSHKNNNLVNKADLKGIKNVIKNLVGKGKAMPVTITW